jgi:hypothetical protein
VADEGLNAFRDERGNYQSSAPRRHARPNVLRADFRKAASLCSFFGRMRGAKKRHALPIIKSNIGRLAADTTNLRLAWHTRVGLALPILRHRVDDGTDKGWSLVGDPSAWCLVGQRPFYDASV